MESKDVDHLMDLLELLPWDPDVDGKGYHLRRGDSEDLLVALDHRRIFFRNAQFDYGRLRDGRGNASVVYATCGYLLDAFDAATAEVVEAIGALIVKPLNLDSATSGAAGRRWCDDLASTAWRLVVSHAAGFKRESRSAGD